MNLISVYVNEEANVVANDAVDVALNYLSRNTRLGVKVELKKVVGNRTDAKGLLESRKLILYTYFYTFTYLITYRLIRLV